MNPVFELNSQRRAKAKTARLHSIAGVLRGRAFEGSFEIGDSKYAFVFRPWKAERNKHRLEVIGDLKVSDGRGLPHIAHGVRASLIAAQGGIGNAPPRDKQPPDLYTASANLPAVESSGPLSFCGALYFKLAPLSGPTLAALSGIQLNARLAPRNDAERRLQAAYSSMVDALYGKDPNDDAAAAALRDINKLITAG